MTPEAALRLWGLDGARCALVAARENRVYRVEAGAQRYALRLRRPGYRSLAELISEMDWLEAMGRAGLRVPRPVASRQGRLVETAGGQSADLVTWLEGAPMGATGAPLDLTDRTGTFRALGRVMAQMHNACDAWQPPAGFARCRWDAAGLLGEAPLWGRFWDNPTLEPGARALMQRFRAAARQALREADLDQGLIHADLVRENVVLGDPPGVIDFDDGGWGYRLFDVATALIKNLPEPDFPALRTALLRGYRDLRPLDTEALDLFMALRAVTYLGWIVPRMAEPGAAARNARFVRTATALCRAYLETPHNREPAA